MTSEERREGGEGRVAVGEAPVPGGHPLPDGPERDRPADAARRALRAAREHVAGQETNGSRGEAEAYYALHKARPFFSDLVGFMISGPVMIQVLEGENASAKNRELMGATDPKKADKGTIRADFAASIDARMSPGPRLRPATKNALLVRTNRAVHRPTPTTTQE